MIASLGMYDRAETARANDALWAAIRSHLGYGPRELDRVSAPMDIWQSPDLLFSQTCGMPYRIGLHRQVQLVGTPDYGIADALPGYYYSVLIVRAGDDTDLSRYRHRTLAYNCASSQSGWAAAQNHAFERGFQFEKLFYSGAHMASAAAVVDGRADIAALDAVSWRMLCKFDGHLADDLNVIQTTAPTPGLPFITGPERDANEINAAVDAAINELDPGHRQMLGLKGIIRIDPAEYLKVRTPAAPDR